jgi:hypothetical protein
MAETLSVPSSIYGSSVPVPRRVNALTFAAATAESWTVPADTNFVIFSGTVPFYMRIGGTAAAPGDTTDGTASFYVGSVAQFKVEEGVAISIIPTGAGVVTIACYSR